MIDTFGSHLIEKYLRESRFRYLVDEDGKFILSFRGDEQTPAYLVQLTAEGPQEQLFCIRVS
ncbi:hypothetical protein ACFVW2_43400, partial [Streptomyces sp. NPDC058171]